MGVEIKAKTKRGNFRERDTQARELKQMSAIGSRKRNRPSSSVTVQTGVLCYVVEVYSPCMASYCLHGEYILRVWHPIGHMQSIFSVYGILLVTCRVHSPCMASYCSHAKYILRTWHPIAHM